MPTILQRGKISRCSAVSRQTFPKNRSSFSWGRTIPWVSHILYLIGNGMRSAGSTNAHCSLHNITPPLRWRAFASWWNVEKSLHPRPKINKAVAGAYDSCPYRRTKAVIAGGRDPWASVVLGGELTLQHSSASE